MDHKTKFFIEANALGVIKKKSCLTLSMGSGNHHHVCMHAISRSFVRHSPLSHVRVCPFTRSIHMRFRNAGTGANAGLFTDPLYHGNSAIQKEQLGSMSTWMLPCGPKTFSIQSRANLLQCPAPAAVCPESGRSMMLCVFSFFIALS